MSQSDLFIKYNTMSFLWIASAETSARYSPNRKLYFFDQRLDDVECRPVQANHEKLFFVFISDLMLEISFLSYQKLIYPPFQPLKGKGL